MRTRFYGRAPMLAYLFAIALAVAVGLSVPAVGQDQTEDVGESFDDELLRELQEDLLDLGSDTSDGDTSDGGASDDGDPSDGGGNHGDGGTDRGGNNHDDVRQL